MTEKTAKADFAHLIPFFVEHSSQPFATADPCGKITFINKACCDTLGYSESELLAMDWAKDLTPPGWQGSEAAILNDLHITGKPVRYEKEYIHKNGSSVPVELLVHLIRDDSGEPLYYYTFITDLTERKQAETRLQLALAEKEILMKELQHRIKNNLNIISGLIDLEMDKLDDAYTRSIFASAKSRINSIATIYEKLYISGKIDTVDLSDYICDISKTLERTYIAPNSNIRIDHSLEHLMLDLRRAVPLGLILNELVTNAIKYAFPELNDGIICISLYNDADTLVLSIRDNGKGLRPGFTVEKHANMGLTLVKMLTEQIHGKLEIKNNSGTEIIISFKLKT